MKLIEIFISSEDECSTCGGTREVYNPFIMKFQTCYKCQGDGSYSGVVNEAKVPEFFLKDMKLIQYEYGDKLLRLKLFADSKRTACAAIIIHIPKTVHLIEEVFGSSDELYKYIFSHTEEICKCIGTIESID
jgi:hypothetical protein